MRRSLIENIFMEAHTFLSIISLAIFASLAAAQTQQNKNCTVFNWDGQPGYLVNATTIRVSAASTCAPKDNNTQNCPITATGDEDDAFSYNISLTLPNGYWNTKYGSESFLYNLILNAVNSSLNGQEWDNYVIGIIDTTQELPPNTSGYINFTPFHRCFEGTMSNCTGGLEDGLAIRACAPVVTPIRDTKAIPILDGTYSVVEIPREDVGNYRNPYAGESRGDAGHSIKRVDTATMALILLAVFGISLW